MNGLNSKEERVSALLAGRTGKPGKGHGRERAAEKGVFSFCEEVGGCGRVDSQWNNALRGPPERFGRKPVEAWKFRIIGKLRVQQETADQKGWEPRNGGLAAKPWPKLAEIPDGVRGQMS